MDFYREMEVPEPFLCPFCRMIRRLSYRKERFLYNRVCDMSGKQVISAYASEPALNRKFPKFPIYENDEWWSDKWDARNFGRDFDFKKPFFEQFFALQSEVPRLALIQQKPMENSVYCNAASRCKNCYLIFSANQNEDCYYGSWINYCRNCIDNLNIGDCELCYECVYSRNCYHCFFVQESKNCSDCYFVKNCIGCKDCFMSVNLVQKQYYIFNKPYSRDEYFKKLKQFDLGSRKIVQDLKQQFKKICGESIVKYYVGVSNENSTGNYINNTKNCFGCFELDDCEDAVYSMNLNKAKSVMDYSHWGEKAERIYECQACGYDIFNLKFCNLCWTGCSDLEYSDNCFSSHHCFGCVGLKKSSYCIFNKQYSKEEYEELVSRIREHMRRTGEYGQFFPEVYSPFGYNESLAYEQLALSKEEVLARGWQWQERIQEHDSRGLQVTVPDHIRDVPDNITEKILTCAASGQHYKIIPQELKFYRAQGLAIPDRCPDQRHFDRLALRNPRRIYSRECAKCSTSIETTYATGRPEKVYCEDCYLKAVC